MFYTDDPVADYERYSAQQERELDKLPVCDRCRKKIHNDYYWDIEGTLYCEKCMNREFRREVVVD